MIKAIKNLIITALTGGIIIGGIGFVPSQSAGYDYTVGIVQLVRHAALDQATQGFKDRLTELVEDAGRTIRARAIQFRRHRPRTYTPLRDFPTAHMKTIR